jgi:8-oxo-dGTP diphosphatase
LRRSAAGRLVCLAAGAACGQSDQDRRLALMEPHKHWPGEYEYCPQCMAALEHRHIGGSLRRACPECDFIHWRNPGIGAAVVVFDGSDRLLLVKRAESATRPGLWSIPAGFVNYGEEIRDAAARELKEETGLDADIGEPVFVASNFHDPEKLTVGIWFSGTVTGGTLQAGDDAVEANYFSLDDLPPLAFDTDVALIGRIRSAPA